MTTKKAFVSGHNYIQDIHMEPGVYTVLMKVKSMYGDVCSFALFDGTTWTHYDMDTVQGQWKWTYVTFRTLVPMTKINLISRNYSAGLPVYVVEPQIVAGNVPFDAGVAPADLNKESKELQSILQSMDSYIEGAFKDGLIESSEAKAIEKYLNTLHERKVSVDASYTQLHGNSFLEGAPKTNLENAKTALNTAYTNLIDSINGAISDGKTTQLEKDDVDAKFGLFSTSLAAYQARAGEANKAIQDKLKGYSDSATQEAADAAAAANNAKTEAEKVRAEYTSDFSILSGKVESKVSQTDFNALGSRVSSAESTITQLPNQIALSVTESKQYTDGKVDAADQAITDKVSTVVEQSATQWKVEVLNGEDTVMAAINADASGVKIQGDKVEIDGMLIARNLMIPIHVLPYEDPCTLDFNSSFSFDAKLYGLKTGGDYITLPGAADYEGIECTIFNGRFVYTKSYYGVAVQVPSGSFLLNLPDSNNNLPIGFVLPLGKIIRLKAVSASFWGDEDVIYWYVLNPEDLTERLIYPE